jgi:hypothetical protein
MIMLVGWAQAANTAELSKDDLTVSYYLTSSSTPTYSHITYMLPFLDKINRGETVRGYYEASIKAPFPQLSAQVSNNLGRTALLTQAVFTVRSSMPINYPLIIPGENWWAVNKTFLVNQGWADTLAGRLTILGWAKFVQTDTHWHCTESSFPYGSPSVFNIGPISRDAVINLSTVVPAEFINKEESACILGRFEYTWRSDTSEIRSQVLNFHTGVSLRPPPPAAPPPITAVYDLSLPCGRERYQAVLPISQEIRAGAVDHFAFKTWTERTCRIALDVSFETTERMQIPADKIELDVFVPRWPDQGVEMAKGAVTRPMR